MSEPRTCPECKGLYECDCCEGKDLAPGVPTRAELEAQIAAVTAERDRAIESVTRLRADVEHERDEALAQLGVVLRAALDAGGES